jgi:hypothetical protein
MYKWTVQGQLAELSEYDYYDTWLGVIETTMYLGGLLGGYFDLHDKNGSLLENHAYYLQENVNLVEDQALRAMLKKYEKLFADVIKLDHEAVAQLAQALDMEMPKSTKEYKLIYKKFKKEQHHLCAHGYLSHPDFTELRKRYLENWDKKALLKERIISYLLEKHPELVQSEYLIKQVSYRSPMS